MNLKEKAQKLLQSKDEEARVDIIARCLVEIKHYEDRIEQKEARIKDIEDGGDISDSYYDGTSTSMHT